MYSANRRSSSGSLPCSSCCHEFITGVAPDEMACIICRSSRNWHQANTPPTSYAEDILLNETFPSYKQPNAFTYSSGK